MRIMHVITGLAIGGAEMMLLKLLAARASDTDPLVVSLGDRGPIGVRIEALGIPVRALGLSRSAPNPVALATLAGMVRRFAPQLIQGWMYHGNLVASFAGLCAGQRVPVLWSIRQSLSSLAVERWTTAAVIRLGARLSRHPAAIIYNSETSAAQHEAIGYAGGRRQVIPNGFDCDAFRPSEAARRRIRAGLGLADEAVVVGHVARFHPMKDHRTLLAAAGIVARDHPAIRFLLAGAGVTAEQPQLRELIVAHGLQVQVRLLGERGDIPDLTAAFDIACLASARGEGFPNVVGEAMACGVPCVVTDVGDSARVVGETGLVVPPGNADALARAIGRLIAAGAAARQRLGAAARQRVETEFSLPAIARRYQRLYESIAAPSAP